MYSKFFKRVFDLFIAFIGLIVLSPLLIVLIVVGAVAMKGNPFFIQKRPGKINKKTGKEKIFSLLKFRTMSNKKDSQGKLLPDAKRLNTYGKILRATSLDELPELINIFVGDMSIVGPRPLLPSYLDRYEWERKRHLIRPGLTGLAQVNGRNTLTWKKRFEIDIEYVEKVSFWLDIKICFKTVKKVFVREGITYKSTETINDYFDNRDKEKEII